MCIFRENCTEAREKKKKKENPWLTNRYSCARANRNEDA